VRFTQGVGVLNVILLELSSSEFGIRGIDATAVTDVVMPALGQPVHWRVSDGMLWLRLPERMPVSPAHVLRLGPGARPVG
jgi:alpha-L-fucosidase